MRIDLRGLQAGVAKLLLDVADVGPVFQHEGRAGVPEQVTTAGLPHSRRDDIAGYKSGAKLKPSCLDP